MPVLTSPVQDFLSRAKLDRGRPMRDQIYPLVRDMILSGVIKPGDTIDEKALATHLNTSRTPVREAVKKLSDEHLVDVVAQSGTRAARIDTKEIEQAYIIRRSLEMETAFAAASKMNDNAVTRLWDVHHLHERALRQQLFEKCIAIDDDFHRTIAMIAELPRLWHMIEISKAHLDRCRYMLSQRKGEAAITLEQHRHIIEVLATGNPDASREAMRFHLDASYKKIAVMLAD